MKRLTVVYPDDMDLGQVAASGILTKAVSVHLDDVSEKHINGNGNGRKNHPRVYIAGMTVQKCIMDHYSPGAKFSAKTADLWCTKAGYKTRSSFSACSTLIKHGFLQKVSKQEYMFKKPFAKDQLRADYISARSQKNV